MASRMASKIAMLFAGLLVVVPLASPAAAHDPQIGVDPSTVSATVVPGGDLVQGKTVHTAEVPPTPDIVFLADTTGSMGPAIANVQGAVGSIMTEIAVSQPNARFAVAEYEDFDCGSDDPFLLNQAITADQTAVQTAVNTWQALPGEGCDEAESQLFALNQIATDPAIGFRANSTRIIAWFGDAPGHDPSGGVTLPAAIDSLQAAGIRVVAVNTPTPFNSGLDATGQATAITTATTGVFLDNVAANQVSQAILDGIQAISVTVTPQVGVCDAGLSLAFNPTSLTVESGEDASFTETISVALNAPQGQTLNCTVDWLVEGALSGPEFVQQIAISVPDVTAPTAECAPTTNPAGKQIPQAGTNPMSGQNPDGFYELSATDNVDPDPDIFVLDPATGTEFGPLDSGTAIKYTQAPGATSTAKKMGSGLSAVAWHIIGQGDAVVSAVDAAGNQSAPVSCNVPPPPK